jgi:hypothetical protein
MLIGLTMRAGREAGSIRFAHKGNCWSKEGRRKVALGRQDTGKDSEKGPSLMLVYGPCEPFAFVCCLPLVFLGLRTPPPPPHITRLPVDGDCSLTFQIYSF